MDDLDGGGIRLYGSDHPLARQYSSAKARLQLERVEDAGAAIAALVTAHTRVFDDWSQSIDIWAASPISPSESPTGCP